MSWNLILGGHKFSKKPLRIERSSDTIFSPLSDKLISKKIKMLVDGKIVSLDTKDSYERAVKNLISRFGTFIQKLDHSYLLRGTLEFIHSGAEHPSFGKNLDLFSISNPFSNSEPIFLFFEKGKQKEGGIFGETAVKQFFRNPETKKVEAFADNFFKENIELAIPTTLQDITDFDEALIRKIGLRSNITAIKLGYSKEITSLQKLWMPSVSGMSINTQVSGINAYSLVNFLDDGSWIKEQLNYLINYFQPPINQGKFRFNCVDFNLNSKAHLTSLTNPIQRNIFEGIYSRGYRANAGTIISGIGGKETKECIETMKDSRNTDYTNILDGMDLPTNLKAALNREKLLSGNLRYLLLSLRVLPVKYNLSDVKNQSPQKIRMAEAFSKLSPYLLDPKGDEVIVPQRLKDLHFSAVDSFNKENKSETEEYIEDNRLLK